ncbi:phosphopantetheine-binding protein [Holophaga foetida]|uniref:phosphopantetheine-binding protein n=1 Tax=Holophaga foetida TaxID=35839 RepID=UPI0002471CA3|nr:phosphopantetheine-binding protein [Holophaga foetida]
MASAITPHDVKVFIIEALALEDIQPEDIQDDAPLFGDGLGLDSIDALELAIALRRSFDVQLAEDASLKEHLSSIRALTDSLNTLTQR